MTINREWHQANRMPRNATLEQRRAWHLEHARACGCRQPPEAIRRELERLGKWPAAHRSTDK